MLVRFVGDERCQWERGWANGEKEIEARGKRKITRCPFASETDQLGIVRHARIRLLFLGERAAEDAFKDGVFDFVRVGGGADFADAVDPPLPLIRPTSPKEFHTTRQVGGEEGEDDRQ